MTSNGRRPSMEDDLQWKTTSNGRRPPMEDDHNILKVENLSSHSLFLIIMEISFFIFSDPLIINQSAMLYYYYYYYLFTRDTVALSSYKGAAHPGPKFSVNVPG
jgi:hypothetical protein